MVLFSGADCTIRLQNEKYEREIDLVGSVLFRRVAIRVLNSPIAFCLVCRVCMGNSYLNSYAIVDSHTVIRKLL